MHIHQIAHRFQSSIHQNLHRLLNLLVPEETQNKLRLTKLIHLHLLVRHRSSDPLLHGLQARISSKAPTSPLPGRNSLSIGTTQLEPDNRLIDVAENCLSGELLASSVGNGIDGNHLVDIRRSLAGRVVVK